MQGVMSSGELSSKKLRGQTLSSEPLFLWTGPSWWGIKNRVGSRSSIVPWWLLAKGKQECKAMPVRCVRLWPGDGEHPRGASCHVAAQAVMG